MAVEVELRTVCRPSREAAWQIALNREPTRDEAKLAEELLAKHGLPTLCRALFNTNEFIVID